MKKALRYLLPNFWLVTGTSFLTDISSEMIVSLIPRFLSNILSVHTAMVGLIDGVAETKSRLLMVNSGALTDKLCHRIWGHHDFVRDAFILEAGPA